MKATQIDQLVVTQYLAGLVPSERFQRAEHICRMAMDNYPYPPSLLNDSERIIIPAAIARTGGVFVVSTEDMDAVEYLAAQRVPDELPPMPYPRMWIEVWNDEADAAGTFTPQIVDFEGDDVALVAYAILEDAPGATWRCYGIFQENNTSTSVRSWALQAVGSLEEQRGVEGCHPIAIALPSSDRKHLTKMLAEERTRWENVLHGPVLLVQLLTTLGARHVSVSAPRARRRDFARRYAIDFPNIYIVDLRGAGDQHTGHGDREYRHRWIVRGHFRRDPAGRYNVPGKGICTWVRPYVKGPADAPWKGRPVYA